MARRKRLTLSLRNKRRGARTGWGGKRKGAGRKRELTESKRREIVSGYLTYRRKHLDRQAAIYELMDDFGVTHRMVVSCVNEFRAALKPDADIFGYAVEGMDDNEIKDMPKTESEIRKLKPGMYQDRDFNLRLKYQYLDLNLRLVVSDAGEHRWKLCFFWKKAEYREKVLGESTTSFEEARRLAIEARRALIKGQNPIDGSWENAALEKANSKS